jgi:hypothetical protein
MLAEVKLENQSESKKPVQGWENTPTDPSLSDHTHS